MAIIDPSKASSLIKAAADPNIKKSELSKISKETAKNLQDQKDNKNFAFNESLKDYHAKKKEETQSLRANQKAARQKAKQDKALRKTNSDIAAELISNNTPTDQKPEGLSKFGPVINSQTKKIIGIITPNVLTLAANYINLENLCPSEEVTRATLAQFNDIVKDLNNTVENINKVAKISEFTSTGVNTIQQISTTLQATIPIVSATAKAIPVVPGFVVSILDDLDYINNKLLYKSDGTPKLPPIIAGANALTLGIALFSLTLRNVAGTITNLTLALQRCLPEADHKNIEQLSDNAKQYIIYGIDDYNNFDITSYQGFDIRIEEVPYTPTVTRRRAVGYTPSGVPLIQTELSFTSNAQTLVTELKLIIDRDNLKAY
jgi:hypothetical protein